MQRYQQTRHALGSTAYLTLVLADDESPESLFAKLWQKIADFEQRFSRFLPDSELSQFNAVAGRRQTVSAQFGALLRTAKHFAEKTGGLYNPLILPNLQRAGYKGSWPRPEKLANTPDYEGRALGNADDIIIGDTWATIPAQTALDFGGIGKGYLLDELAQLLRAKAVKGYWLSLGGDILCAGIDLSGVPWHVSVQHALNLSEEVAHVDNSGRPLAIATSGVTKRQGVSSHGAWHHIIDPRTGRPANTNLLTATVCAGSAAEADVFAKCLVIAGGDGARKFMQHVGLQDALLQLAAGNDGVTIEKIGALWS